MKKYAIDTNVILSDPNAILAFGANKVILPFTVLEELDNIKSRKVDISRDARVAIRNITALLEDATHEEISVTGVPINRTHDWIEDTATLNIVTVEEAEALVRTATDDISKVETLLKSTVPDDKIIMVALATESILVTRDINMRIKAMAYGVEVQDYRHDVTIEDSDLIHTGHHEVDVDIWSSAGSIVYSSQEKTKLYHFIPVEAAMNFMPEVYCEGDYIYDTNGVMFVYDGLGEYEHEEGKVLPCLVFIDVGQEKALFRQVWGIKAKNIQQAMAINSIMDPDVHLTVLLGSAGTGKTLITLACALELTMEPKHRGLGFSRVIFSKTQDSQFEEIGFLPGSEAEKVIPFCGAAIDALEFLHKDDRDPQGTIEEIMKRNVMQFKALNFIRGRSFIDTILIVDEFQNITPAQAKTILTRAGENCKVIIMGNLSQIDSKFISPVNSGLTYVTEKMKDWPGCRIIELEGTVRSPLAAYAEENL